MATKTATPYADLTRLLRRLTGDEKHDASAHSTLDVLWVLYDRVLRVAPDRVDDPDRDRFLLSKGHGPAAFYAVLAAKGFIPHAWLDDLGGPDSRLGHHPDRMLVPGRGDRLRLARARPRPRRGHRARPARAGPAPAAGVRPARRRRAGRGLQPRGDRVRRRDRPGPAHRDRHRQPLVHPRLAGRDRRAGSPSTAGPRPQWTAATTTRIEAGARRTHAGPAARGRRPRRATRGDRHARDVHRHRHRPAGRRPAYRPRAGRHLRRHVRAGRPTATPTGCSTSASASS